MILSNATRPTSWSTFFLSRKEDGDASNHVRLRSSSTSGYVYCLPDNRVVLRVDDGGESFLERSSWSVKVTVDIEVASSVRVLAVRSLLGASGVTKVAFPVGIELELGGSNLDPASSPVVAAAIRELFLSSFSTRPEELAVSSWKGDQEMMVETFDYSLIRDVSIQQRYFRIYTSTREVVSLFTNEIMLVPQTKYEC